MSQHRISDLADPVEYGDAVTKRYVVARVQGLTDIISEMQPVKNIVEAYNKIFGVIDNQILLLKYEYQGELKWNEVYRSSILTNFFESSSSSTIEHTLYAVKIPGRFTVEYNVSLPTDVVRSMAGSVAYLYGFIQGTYRDMPKYASLEIRRGIIEYNIKNDS